VGVSPKPFVPRRARARYTTQRAEPRRYEILHRTVYRYQNPVERSAHLLRLFPVHDRLQSVHRSEIIASVQGQQRDFEDVFGNRVRRLLVDTPFTELSIEARSDVELFEVDPLDFRPARVRSTIPLVWMPWQRQILAPFLLPPELPESELAELTDYAMSFAHRNDYELLETLLDLNATIFGEYTYQQGMTSLSTSAFDVFVHRRGVCQDFANLFICLARLIGVPARYVCGYLYTGPKADNARMAEASHAWVQVYLPEVGWKGFDPTNGVLTQTHHVRVASGRNYIDATPTSGTLYVGGGGETLSVEVVLSEKA
jgi:transglutaminase-like putative cysteine protease